MYAQLRRKMSRSGQALVEQPAEFEKMSLAQLEEDVACTKERDNLGAIKCSMPAIGAKMTNTHGIEWVVDGHTSASSISTYARGDESELNLYPVVIPQNLSPKSLEFFREVDRCTPKAIVPLDTMPTKFPKRGHPGGHWVDAWSDPYRILLFLDIANLHETVLAHELAHVWIDLVEGIEDYRVWRDKEDTARYSQVQFLQSFVLDQAVNRVLREKAFDLTVSDNDSMRASWQLAEAVQRGYTPPTQREAIFLASSLATTVLEAAEADTKLAKCDEYLLTVRSTLPEIMNMADNMAQIVRENPPVDAPSTKKAIDAILTIAFSETDGGIDLNKDLLEVPPNVSWDHDKCPSWLPKLPVKAKCEVGIAMAKTGATTSDRWELSSNPSGGLQVRFQRDDGTHTEFTELKTISQIPESSVESMQRIINMNSKNRQRIDDIAKSAQVTSGPAQQPFAPPLPGPRSYAPGLACWITQARLEEQLMGEHPYSYAKSNPTTYTDPSGENPDRVGSCAVFVCRQYGWGDPPTPPTHAYLCVTGPNGGCAGGLYPGGGKQSDYEWGVPGNVGDQNKDCKNKAPNRQTGQYRVECEEVTNRTPANLKCDVAAAFCECVRILSRKPFTPRYEGLNVCYAFPSNVADCVLRRTSGAVQAEVQRIQAIRL